MPNPITKSPVILVILDGWGIAPASPSNPITQTELPTFKKLFARAQHSRLWAHGEYVGLPKNQDGNSEAGHLNLGAGRIVKQDPLLISGSIHDGTFFKNAAFLQAARYVKKNNSKLHLLGMLSDGQSAHSTPEHLYALLDLLHSQKVNKVFIHLFTDGRDSLTNAGRNLLFELFDKMHPEQKIGSIMGRFYAMDRKKCWPRTKIAYEALVLGKGKLIMDPVQVFDESYKKGITDEFIEPHIITEAGKPVAKIEDNDAVILFNHRSDRARQLAKPFVQEKFQELNPGSFEPPQRPRDLLFVAMTDFGPDLDSIVTAYPSVNLSGTLPMALYEKKQLYLAESEKFAHITYFFNGGYADPVGGEERLMIPSPSVERYDQTPAMASEEITENVGRAIFSKKYDFIAGNYACLDMIGHTGNFAAAQEALRAVDRNLARIVSALEKTPCVLIVTADHGNIEEMKDLSSGEADTEHSKNQVPFLLWCTFDIKHRIREEGILADVAPTVLDLFGINKPKEMTGNSLFI